MTPGHSGLRFLGLGSVMNRGLVKAAAVTDETPKGVGLGVTTCERARVAKLTLRGAEIEVQIQKFTF